MSDVGSGSTSAVPGATEDGASVPGDRFGFHHNDEKPHEGYVHHTFGPHASDMANFLDPHVPGEYPTDTGEDPHKSNLGPDAAIGGAGLGAAGLGAAAYEAPKAFDPTPMADDATDDAASTTALAPTTPAPEAVPVVMEPAAEPVARRDQPIIESEDPITDPEQSDLGHDEAVIVAAPVMGGGAAYAVSQPYDEAPKISQEPMHRAPEGSVWPTSGKEDDLEQREPMEAEQHDGRNAALGAGAGALAGGATYEATRPAESAPPPVVEHMRPIPTTTQDDTAKSAGAWSTPGRATEQAQPVPSKREETRDDYRKDAAVVGGGAAAGYGGYETTKDHEESPTSPSQHSSHQHKDHNKLQKSPHQQEKHERELRKAREEQAEKGGDHGEKGRKHGLLHKILHPHDKEKNNEDLPHRSKPEDRSNGSGSRTHLGEHDRDSGLSRHTDEDGKVVDPHTGLPMDVGKYGGGAGGTDGAPQIGGYHENRSAE
ncbi:hypothetical protein B0A50_07062 [Salinomyces thailandicus]|uniref:Uncharacterized protein n=1 Tax=Salinomyces thailandicus TaxID=706561 RepID=A0A4U0TP32_9PEZI|nr:hypothetical protein B0A50_07062 [Salinomyces thailandica]